MRALMPSPRPTPTGRGRKDYKTATEVAVLRLLSNEIKFVLPVTLLLECFKRSDSGAQYDR
jgi:hypothetical protein